MAEIRRIGQLADKRRPGGEPGQAKPRPTFVDVQTGEVMEGVPVLVRSKIPSPYGDRWMQLSQDPLLEIAQDREVTLQVHRVLMYLNAVLDFDNFIYTPQVEISKHLRMDKSSVSQAIQVLVDKSIVVRGPKIGQSSTFRLNPLFGWKGKIVALRKELTPEDSTHIRHQKKQRQKRQAVTTGNS